MTTKMPPPSHPPTLPPEIILHIISSLAPTGKIPIALPATDPITKTLLSLIRTSRLTYSIALRHLYRFCLYIDSYKRLSGILAALQMHESATPKGPYNLRAGGSRPAFELYVPLLDSITSIYLIPQGAPSTRKEFHLRDCCKLLNIAGPHLKRLLVLFPIPVHRRRQLQEEYIVPTLSKLVSLEVFCCHNNDLGMNKRRRTSHPDTQMVWKHWPKLRILGLPRPWPTLQDWRLWGKMPQLERLIISDYEWMGSLLSDLSEMNTAMDRNRNRSLEVVVLNRLDRALREKYVGDGLLRYAEVFLDGPDFETDSARLSACKILVTGEEMDAAWVAEHTKSLDA